MYRNAYQRGMLTVFFSCGSKPLALWDTFTKDGYITRFLDPDIKSSVYEIGGTNVSTTYMISPKGNVVFGITLPFLVMVVKNLKKYFSFEVTILDESGTRRRFRVSNFQSTTQILPLCTVMPIGLSDGWNQIQFNMAEFTRRAYKKQFIEVHKLKINANIRLRRVYFAEKLLPEEHLPPEYRLYFPIGVKAAKTKGDIENKENLAVVPSVAKGGSKIEISKVESKILRKSSKVQTETLQLEQLTVTEIEKLAKQQSKVTLEVVLEHVEAVESDVLVEAGIALENNVAPEGSKVVISDALVEVEVAAGDVAEINVTPEGDAVADGDVAAEGGQSAEGDVAVESGVSAEGGEAEGSPEGETKLSKHSEIVSEATDATPATEFSEALTPIE